MHRRLLPTQWSDKKNKKKTREQSAMAITKITTRLVSAVADGSKLLPEKEEEGEGGEGKDAAGIVADGNTLLPGAEEEEGEEGQDAAAKKPVPQGRIVPASAPTNAIGMVLPERELEKPQKPPDKEGDQGDPKVDILREKRGDAVDGSQMSPGEEEQGEDEEGKDAAKQEKQNKVDTEGVIRVTVSGRHPKPVTQKCNERGKFWKEETLKKDEVLGTVNYELSLRLDSSPEDIRDELLKHFNVKEEAKESHNLLLSTTDEKRTSFKLADFKQLKDLNLDKLKPVLHVKFELKSKADMQALPNNGLPVKRIEKRCSRRLAHQNDTNAANVERAAKKMYKADVANKKEKSIKKRRREEASRSKPSTSQKTAKRDSAGRKSPPELDSKGGQLGDSKGIKPGTGLFPNTAAGECKLLRKLLRDSLDLHRSDCLAASRVSAASAGRFSFTPAVNEGVAQDEKTIYNVMFKQHVEGKGERIDESVLITVDQQTLEQDISMLCMDTQFLEADMRVSSASLSRTNTEMFWSIVFCKSGGAARKVDVNAALQEIAPGRYWEHLPETESQIRPPRKCKARACSATQKQGSSELVIPRDDIKDEAALLLAAGPPMKNAMLALILNNRRGEEIEKLTGNKTLAEVQLETSYARSILCAKMEGHVTETESKEEKGLANCLHVAVRYLFYAQDITFLVDRDSREVAGAQHHADTITQDPENHIPEENLVKMKRLMDDKDWDGGVRDVLAAVKEVLSKLEKELGSKQARDLIECHEKEVLLWVRKTMTVVLVLLGVSQVEVTLSSNGNMSRPQKNECLNAAFNCFEEAQENCNALFTYTQVMLSAGQILEGNGCNASDLLSHRRFEIMSKLLTVVTKADDSKLVGLLIENIVDDLEDLREIRDVLLKGFGGKANILSEVDSVGLHECLQVVETWIFPEGEEESESEDEDKHELGSEGENLLDPSPPPAAAAATAAAPRPPVAVARRPAATAAAPRPVAKVARCSAATAPAAAVVASALATAPRPVAAVSAVARRLALEKIKGELCQVARTED